MDDEDSKARRNFMAVSTIIVLAWWLQAPLDKISEKLLGMSSVGPGFEWRAWFAALVALVYFALRFRFSAGHHDAVAEMKKERQELRLRLLKRWLSLEAFWYVKFGVAPLLGKAVKDLSHATSRSQDFHGTKVIKMEVTSVGWSLKGSQEKSTVETPSDSFMLRVDVVLHTGRDRGLVDTERRRFDMVFARSSRAFLAVWASCWLAIYSKTSTSFVVPWLIGAAAAAVCGLRTWQAAAGI